MNPEEPKVHLRFGGKAAHLRRLAGGPSSASANPPCAHPEGTPAASPFLEKLPSSSSSSAPLSERIYDLPDLSPLAPVNQKPNWHLNFWLFHPHCNAKGTSDSSQDLKSEAVR